MKKSAVVPLYEKTAREFAQRAHEALREEVLAVVLYGSVARHTATEESDIDLLVLARGDGAVRERLVAIGEALDYENSFDTFLVPTQLSPEKLRELATGGFPIAGHVLREGVPLYDDGSFKRLREEALAGG
jgi:hypothetical protein